MKAEVCLDRPVELDDFHMRYIVANSIKTGSRVFGNFKKNSDYDYVMLSSTFKLEFELEGPYITDPHYDKLDSLNFQSLRFTYKNRDINLIVVTHRDSYEAWQFATDALQNNTLKFFLLKSGDYKQFFEELKKLFIRFYSTRK